MPATLDDASRLLDALYATGPYPALQVCVRHQGQIVLHRALGRYRPLGRSDTGREASCDTRFMLFSLSKCVTATCMPMLFERSALRVDDPVRWFIRLHARAQAHPAQRLGQGHRAGVRPLGLHAQLGLGRSRDADLGGILDQQQDHLPAL